MSEAIHHEPAARSGSVRRPGAAQDAASRPAAIDRLQIPSPGQIGAALQGAKICLFSQDRQLRYTWISGPLCDVPPAEILGRTDADLGPAFVQPATIAAKRDALENGDAIDTEFSCAIAGGEAFFGLHIEPARAADGTIQGIVCAAQEITGRREREAHLRLLMREITHRSKNLLAVIQGMARQTARHAGSIGNFLDLFSARLQAMAHSHDLLVQQSWHGAGLEELIRAQLAGYLDRCQGKISLKGPAVWLDPEAAQSLGLAVHELAANAAKFGALSLPSGKVSVAWHQGGHGVDIVWNESGGPAVEANRQPGFGSVVIEKNLPRALDANVHLDFHPQGLRCEIALPAKHLAKPDRPEHFAPGPR